LIRNSQRSQPVAEMHQRGLSTHRMERRAHVIHRFEEAPLMRLKVRSLRQAVKGDLPIEFVPQRLTSYGGLELVRRYVRQLAIIARLRAALAAIPSDYGSARLALLIIGLFYVGARRLEHLQYLVGDPLVARFCGLARLPSNRTVSNWLKQFTQATLAPLVQLNHDLVVETLGAWRLPRLTIDVDGTVVCTGAQVQWAFRGFNPHHRKHLSYYPLLAHVAQTGHILRLKNRPGNVHDSKQAVPFLRDIIDDLRARFGRRLVLELRIDAACRGWQPVAPGVTGHETELVIPQWHDLRLRVVLFRKHVAHHTRKNFQLDLFTPDDGH